jgi:glutamyl-tRNA reductase
MIVLVTGLNHRTAPVEVRERLAFEEQALADALAGLRRLEGVGEAMLLSTCNRVEIAVTAESEAAFDALARYLASARGVDPAWLGPHLYRHSDREAIRHLFRVASSLDSMVLGEPQILGQMKAAWAAARDAGTLEGFLDTVLSRAFSVAKRVRSETEIGRSAVSVSYAAIDLARQIFGDLSSKRVLLVGAGKMSELAGSYLKRAGCAQILVTNRTRSRAEDLAAAVGGAVIDYAEFRPRLAEMDIVLTSSGAPEYLLTKEDLRQVLKRRHNRPVFLIDIAVPRNVDPAANDLENVYLYDIDDLGREVAENRVARQREAEEAEKIIDEEIDRLLKKLKAREVTPTIVGLQQRLDEMARAEIERLRPKLGELSAQQEEALAGLARSLMNKVAHGPLTELKRAAAEPDGDRTVALIRRIFRLE